MLPNVLSIAGTDPSGGAGVQADLKTFGALGAYGMAVITAVLAQNTQAVRSIQTISPSLFADQLDSVFEDIRVDAVKIGMVANSKLVEILANRLRYYQAKNIVFDPVMVASSGKTLLDEDALAVIRQQLIPLTSIITPNLPEAAVLLGAEPCNSVAAMREQVLELKSLGSTWVLLKGGHLGAELACTDVLTDGQVTHKFSTPRIITKNGHGTGCTLSSAIAALLPKQSVEESVHRAKQYLQQALMASEQLEVGKGRGPLHHFYQLKSEF